MMNKPICVRSSVHVKPTRDFNHQQQELAEQKRFERLMEQFKADLIGFLGVPKFLVQCVRGSSQADCRRHR